jgi:hypothetical protein
MYSEITDMMNVYRLCRYLDYIAVDGRRNDELERIWKEAIVA